MNWQRLSLPALAVLLSSACSGGGGPELGVATTVADVAPTAVETTASPDSSSVATTSTTAQPVVPDAPESLAFASANDLGRLFEADVSVAGVTAYGSPGGEAEPVLLEPGVVVQATKARVVGGALWALVREPLGEGEQVGWVAATQLVPSSQTLFGFDADLSGEFRQVARVIQNDVLKVMSSPGAGSEVGELVEDSVAIHGGNSALTPNGVWWIDVIDLTSGSQLGWVERSQFSTLSGGLVRDGSGADVARRAEADLTYGASLGAGAVSALGCNAAQITFSNTSASMGLAIVFGKSSPIGSPLGRSGKVAWSAAGGSTIFVDPAETVIFTLPTQSAATWYFAALDGDGQAASNTNNDAGNAVASDSRSFDLDSSICGPPPPEPVETPELVPPTIAPGVDDLPEEERQAALDAFEEELESFKDAQSPNSSLAPAPAT